MVRKNTGLIFLLILTIAIKIFSLDPEAVEKYYSQGLYLYISRMQRFLLGWIPFSFGDLLYLIAGIWMVINLSRFVFRLTRQRFNRLYVFKTIRKTLMVLLIIYAWFNISWGLNYNRIGIAETMKLEKREDHSKEELADLMVQLSGKLNLLYPEALEKRDSLKRKRHLFKGSIQSYEHLAVIDPSFQYEIPSVKPSVYSYLGNYLGFTGYYNPFTGEAQVNTTVPVYIQPFTTCHEIGHQLGYAKESEANLAAFLSARNSTNEAFRYSVYFDLYLYARSYMGRMDSLLLKSIDSSLAPGIRSDIRYMRNFFLSHANPLERLIDRLYSQYLKANEQPSGRISYNEVILLLMAYKRKYGEI